ncbi:MAG: polymerase subunit sigma-24 [Chthoniobacteraceae bacterium]|nr:polymerase subunit sigma-24 [Chthoniobacteraceae bacterium]
MRVQESDESVALMLRLKAGDDLALNALMRLWQKPVVSFALRYTGNLEDARDLAQETFVRLYENRLRYEPAARFSTWLFAIVSNLCRNHARWQSRHPTVQNDELENERETFVSEERSPADNAARNDLASAVRQHVQALPHDLKSAVLLFDYEGLSQEQIAHILGCTVKAVETRLYRARHLLRERLSRWKVEPLIEQV